jgi:hypothetical protein
MLSRARRSLKGHFDEIATGERCVRMRPVMVAVSHGLAGKRDRRTLARHVRYCRSCRQEAIEIGLEEFVNDSRHSFTRNALSRAAAFLPLPFLRRRLLEEPDAASGIGASTGAHAHLAQLGTVAGTSAEQTASVLQKAAALVAVAAVAGGGGIVAHRAGVNVSLPKIAGSEKKATPEGGIRLDPAGAANVDGGRRAATEPGDGRGEAPAAGGALPAGPQSPATALGIGGEGQAGTPSSDITPAGPGGPLGGETPLAPRPENVFGTPSPDPVHADPGKTKEKKKDSSSSDDPLDPLPPTSDDPPALTEPESELNRGLRQRLERGRPLPPGIEKNLDEAAEAEPLSDAP